MSPVGKAQCFAVQRGEIIGSQMGAPRYAPKLRAWIRALSASPYVQGVVSDFADLNPSVPFGHLLPNARVGFIPMGAIGDQATGEIEIEERSLSEVYKGFTPFCNGDVIWAKITPCMQNGKSGIVNGLPNGIGFGSTEFHVLRPRDSRLMTTFLWEFISMESVRRAGVAFFTGSAGQQRVPSTFLKNLPLPLPPYAKQRELVMAMEAARAARRAKLAEADALLGGLDSFLLKSLGLVVPTEDRRMVFSVPAESVEERLDPHYYSPSLTHNMQMLRQAQAEPLGTLVKFSEETWEPESHDAPTFRYIEIGNVNTHTGEAVAKETAISEAPSRARMIVRENDILVSLTRPHHGAIAQIASGLDGCVASTGFSVLRGIKESRIKRDYLWCVLRAKFCLLQMLQRASGGNYPAITETELAKVLVPVPALSVQELIVDEVARRHEASRLLRQQAEAVWQQAKEDFEAALLGHT